MKEKVISFKPVKTQRKNKTKHKSKSKSKTDCPRAEQTNIKQNQD